MSNQDQSASKGRTDATDNTTDNTTEKDDIVNPAEPSSESVGGEALASPADERRGGGTGIALLSLLLAAAAGVGAYLLWQDNAMQHQRFAQRMDQLDKAMLPVASIGGRLGTIETRLSRLESALPEGVSGQLQRHDEAIKELGQRLAAVASPEPVDLGPLVERLDGVEAAIESLQQQSGQWVAHTDWESHQGKMQQAIDGLATKVDVLAHSVETLQTRRGGAEQRLRLAEGAHLLRIADEALSLRRDPDMARQALERADALLEPVAAATDTRQAISKALAGLESITMPDSAALSAQIEALERQAAGLPQTNTSPHQHRMADAGEGQGGHGAIHSVKAFFATVWDSIRSLVTVRRSSADDMPLRAPEQQWFLVENLRLKLETARLALLRGDEATYQAALKEGQRLLETYFVRDDAAVSTAIATLDRLAGLAIAPPLPDLKPLLESIEHLQQRDGLAVRSVESARRQS